MFGKLKAQAEILKLWHEGGAANMRLFHIAKAIQASPAEMRGELVKQAIGRVGQADFFCAAVLIRAAEGMEPEAKRAVIDPLFDRGTEIAKKQPHTASNLLCHLLRSQDFPKSMVADYIPRVIDIMKVECVHEDAKAATLSANVQAVIQDLIPPQDVVARSRLMTAAADLVQFTVEKRKANMEEAARRLTRLADLVPADYVLPPASVEMGAPKKEIPVQIAFVCAAVDKLVPRGQGPIDFGQLYGLADKFACAVTGAGFEGFKGKNVALSGHFTMEKGVMAVFNWNSQTPHVVVRGYRGSPLDVRGELMREEFPRRADYINFVQPFLAPADQRIEPLRPPGNDNDEGGAGTGNILLRPDQDLQSG